MAEVSDQMDRRLRDVAEAVCSVERILFETLASAESGDALRALAELPDAIRGVQGELRGVTEALREVRDAISGDGGRG